MTISKNRQRKTDRPYRRITPATVAKHKAMTLEQGNGTRAVEVLEDEYKRPDMRSVRIMAKSDSVSTTEYIDNSLQQMASNAMDRINKTIMGRDETLALNASKYVTDHLRGKAVTRSENKTLSINIESVL